MSESARRQTPDLDRMSVPELTALIEAAETKRSEKMSGARAALLEEFREKAQSLGVSLESLVGRRADTGGGAGGGGRTRKRRSDAGQKAPPRYRDPVTGNTWSGRGREPGWLKGKDRQKYAV